MRLFRNVIFTCLLFVLATFFCGEVLAVTPQISPKPAAVDSYELFWPIVAGKVQGDSLYSLKLFKEKARAFLIFSSAKKAEYFSVLSTKRLVEFEKLALTNKNFGNASKTLEVYLKTLEKIVVDLDKAKNSGADTTGTAQILTDAFDKQLSLLESIAVKIDKSLEPAVQNAVLLLSSMVKKLQ